ncbi:MAG: radical SAM protein [Candidatus Sericytochromatia bacterium]|nr:radical SAM protein [Candidatus Sericytochromatia bacterium]
MYALESLDAAALRTAVATGAPHVPLRVKIKLIWACNLKCPFCSQWRALGQPPPRPGRLDEARLTALLDDLVALGCRRIHFSGGEPLLKPDLARWVSEVVQRGMVCSLTSNGTLWTPEKAEALIAAGLSTVTFSLDSHLQTVHDRMRGQPLWQATIQGIRTARRTARALGRPLKIRTNTVVARLNYRALADLPDFLHDLGVRRMSLLPVDDQRTHGTPPLRLEIPEITEWNREVAPRLAERALRHGLMREEAQAYPFGREEAAIALAASGEHARGFYQDHRCFAPWLHAVVAADGKVYGCCQMKGEGRVLGDLTEDSFRAIWTGETYTGFRRALAQARPPVCRRCDDFLPENAEIEARLAAAQAPAT